MEDSSGARSASTPRRVHPAALGVLLGLAVTTLFLSTLTAANSYDSIAYSLDVERTLTTGHTGTLVHDYHAAWNFLGLAVAVTVPGLRGEPLLAFQLLNALAAGILVGLMAAWLLRKTERLWLSLGAALLVPNVAFWHHATDGEPYAVASLLLFSAFLLAPFETGDTKAWRRLVAAAIALGAGIAVHLAVVVVSPVFAAGLLFSVPLRRGLRRAAAFLAIAAAVSLIPYLIEWTVFEGYGVVQSFRTMVNGVLVPTWPRADYYLVEPWSPFTEFAAILASFAPTLAALRIVPLALSLLGALGCVLAWRRGARTSVVAFATILVQLLFFASYNLASPKFIVVQATFLVPAGLLGWWEWQRERPSLARFDAVWPALALILVGVNLSGTVKAQLQPENNRHIQAALAIGANTAPEDAILMLGLGSDRHLKVYVPYFARREALILDFLGDGKELGPEELLRRLEWRLLQVSERGGVVHATPRLLRDSAERRLYLTRHQLGADWFLPVMPVASVAPSVSVGGLPLLHSLAPLVGPLP